MLNSLCKPGRGLRVAIIGASGGIGSAFTRKCQRDSSVEQIFAFSRNAAAVKGEKTLCQPLDITSEAAIDAAADTIRCEGEIDLVLIASGLLHEGEMNPEKDWRHIRAEHMAKSFAVNAIGPALVFAAFADLLPKGGKSVMAALSARVGSISDNRLGGWYAYRSSKAALNQIIKTASVELRRKRKEAIILGLHPGTVDTPLSKPFQGMSGDRFSPEESVTCLLDVIESADLQSSGRIFDWQGVEVPA